MICLVGGFGQDGPEEDVMTAPERTPQQWAQDMLMPGRSIIVDTVICARTCLTVLKVAYASRSSVLTIGEGPRLYSCTIDATPLP